MIQLSKAIHQEFYKNLLDNYLIRKQQGGKDDEYSSFALKNNVQISFEDTVTEIVWPNQTFYKGPYLHLLLVNNVF